MIINRDYSQLRRKGFNVKKSTFRNNQDSAFAFITALGLAALICIISKMFN